MDSSAPSQSARAIRTLGIPGLTGRNKCFWSPKLKYRIHSVMDTALQKQAFKIKAHSTFKTKDKLCNK